ncbi:MAG TPA: cob(I)yrinic acid a,c-diamide adenosyltransferase [Firmicutes bacterium]|nr:cob(I)yrinic acid a,c-diamide adenosyltransferase [Candidatus Fermentithermobacillaceae bacterium]
MSGKDKLRRGLIMVYTGDGKGKTTAALGLALRQVGWGRRVLVIQFMKGRGNVYGERIAAEKYLPLLEIEQHGRDEFVNLSDPAPVDIELARKALGRAKEALESGRYGMIVLDEVNVAVYAGLLSVQEVLALIDSKPDDVDLVLTGRYARQEVMDRADMVSEVREVKHHYRKGVPAQEGIEY